VHHAGGVRVVVVQAVHQDAVRQRGVAQRQPVAQADHAARPGAGEARHRAGEARRERLAARSEGAADGVEHQVLGARQDALRSGAQPGGELAEPQGERHLSGQRSAALRGVSSA
jgi:hypothetical protein